MKKRQNSLAKSLKLQKSLWQLEDLLPLNYPFDPQILTQINPNLHHHFCLLLSRDVYSEGDSFSLFQYLQNRRGEFSPEFWQMITQWFADEQKHYEALRRVYRLMTGVSFTEMDEIFAQRTPEIQPIQALLTDEFTLLVAFLFDELGSTISYRRDLWEYYRHYGPVIRQVGKHLVQDEGIHFQNAVQLLKAYHGDRLEEMSGLLQQIAQLEKALGRYCQTFFLDHAQESFRFPENFNGIIIEMILAQFGLAPFPAQIQHLWQWKPQGWDFVPLTTGNPGAVRERAKND
jgi:hypothetical protein